MGGGITSDFYSFLSVSLCFPSFLKHTHLFNKKQFNITPGEKGTEALGVASQEWGFPPPTCLLQGVSPCSPRQGDGLAQLWPAGILIAQGPQWGQEGLWSLRAHLSSQTCLLAPQPPPCPPHTHCRRSCRPSFHTSGLFSRVTDSSGPLETGGWREGRRAVLVRAPPRTHHLLHRPHPHTQTGHWGAPSCERLKPLSAPVLLLSSLWVTSPTIPRLPSDSTYVIFPHEKWAQF